MLLRSLGPSLLFLLLLTLTIFASAEEIFEAEKPVAEEAAAAAQDDQSEGENTLDPAALTESKSAQPALFVDGRAQASAAEESIDKNNTKRGEAVATSASLEQPQPAQGEIVAEADDQAAAEQPQGSPALRLLGTDVLPATSVRLAWSPSQHFEGVYSATSVLVVNGAEPGPTLCLTAAIHGDEINGIETVRRVVYNLNADTLRGAVVGVPIVNLQGFHRSSRYLIDRRDLNRHFPGDANGSSAARIARSFFDEIVTHCDAVVDLHTGSFYRTNLPQLRGDLSNPKVVEMTRGFGSTVVLHSRGAEGTLRRAAVNAGIPAVTLEAGAPMVLDEKSVNHSVKGIRTLLNQLDMVSKFRLWGDPEPVYYNSTWQRATTGGIIFSDVSLGQNVRVGDLLGTVTNPITNVRREIRSEHNGRVLGMAMNQVVQPGFAAYHIGIQAPEEQISPPAQVTAGNEADSAPADQPASAPIPVPAEEESALPVVQDSREKNADSTVPPRNGEGED